MYGGLLLLHNIKTMVYVPSDIWTYYFNYQRKQRFITLKNKLPSIKQPRLIIELNGIGAEQFVEMSVSLPRQFYITWMIWNAPHSNETFFRTTFERVLNIHHSEIDPWHGTTTVNQYGTPVRQHSYDLMDEDVWMTTDEEEDED